MTAQSLNQEDRPPVGLTRLWLGVLTAPAAWLLMEIAGYYLAARNCEPAIGGVSVGRAIHASTTQVALDAVAIIAAVSGLWVSVGSWRAFRSMPDRHTSPAWGRARFLALIGVLTSALFLGGIVLFGLSPLLVSPCSQAL
jgi:hypothetical protein